ncbi:MAG: agmatine/peptidylarginine deiminase [Gammaproteobacteria bacterium]
MPPETAPQSRVWMAFPRAGATLGAGAAERAAGYAAWAAVAHAVADWVPVTMIVDPTETARARHMLSRGIEIIEQPIDDFWLRDSGPTFVHTADGSLAAIDWIFNAWGGGSSSQTQHDRALARFIADRAGVPVIPSLLVNEGGGFHVDGAGTVLLTETVQLGVERNPHADADRVEFELTRLLGIRKAIWLPRGLHRDYQTFGTRGHVDMVATFPAPGTVLLHAQPNPGHPDHAVMAAIRALLADATDAEGRPLSIVELPAPETLSDPDGFVDWNYVNHLVTNDAVIACAFGETRADDRARGILADFYPGRRIVPVDARELFARGGGVHCITQQQPRPIPRGTL